MSDYIERQKAIRWVQTECNSYGKPTLDFESGKKVIEYLERMPSADVVQVVRCKDCIYNTYYEVFCFYLCEHAFMAGEVKPDFYCAYSERKKE